MGVRLGWVVAVWTAAAGCRNQDPLPAPEVVAPPVKRGDYRFSSDWTTPHADTWARVLTPLKGQPGVRYLEIGVFEGRSLIWMLDHVLTHPTSTAVGIDVFPDNLRSVYDHNLAASGHAGRVTTRSGFSNMVLRTLQPLSFDIIYVDGSHTPDDVLEDAVGAWALLKDGGIIIFDDFEWPGGDPPVQWPAELTPRPAIDAFVSQHRHTLDVVHRGYQLIVRKKPHPCGEWKWDCSVLGDYRYQWQSKQLRSIKTGREVPLTAEERGFVEVLARDPGSQGARFHVDAALQKDPSFQALCQRLGLQAS